MQKDISIVIPTKNEEISIKTFLEWCSIGLERAGLNGEIILMDSSSDETAVIARSLGAKVINVRESGLGNAYKAAQGKVNGKIVILGDADCTYDFRNLDLFLEKLNDGFDFVMGNRFLGTIEKGAMPLHHQYFGSPATSLIFKFGLGLPTGDIHCGMRAMTSELFNRLPFLEEGWEYATEMIVSARNLNAKITEVPISFYKDLDGRLSHHRRASWLSPFRAGWGTLRVITTYLIDRLFVIPGVLISGLTALFNLSIFLFQETYIQRFHIGLLTQSILVFISSVGVFAFTSGVLARFAYRRNLRSMEFIANRRLTKKLFSLLVFVTIIEILLSTLALSEWTRGLGESGSQPRYNIALISGWLSFTSVYLLLLGVSIVSLIGNHAQKFRD
jgi:glycosyltransferase involved in cell wall biosynthesis